MPARRRPERWHLRSSSVALVVVAVLAGVLFATSARLFSDATVRPPRTSRT